MISTMVEYERQTATGAFGHRDPELPDLGELLRLVVIRNDRLKRLIALEAPGIVVRNEQRMLRAAVDAVIAHGGVVDRVTRDAAGVPAGHVGRAAAESRRGSAATGRRALGPPQRPNDPMPETGG